MLFYDTLSSEAQQCLENKPKAISYWLNVNTHEKYLSYKMNLWESEESIVVDCLVPTCVGVIVLTRKSLKSYSLCL